MKKVQLHVAIAAISLVLGMMFTSCKEDDPDTPENNTDTILTGEITEDLTLTSDQTWYLRGDVHVVAPATLTIEEGTEIIAQSDVVTYLLIEQGAKIDAVGTATKPIVFTADVKESGAWGSIHICGKAPINVQGGAGSSEIGDAAYGGSAANDNSGKMKYCILEYTGTSLDEEHESNGLSLYGVGNGTTLEYIQIYKGDDDGIEFFGGTVNIKYAMVYGAKDDCFDWTQGWTGKGQYLLAKQIPGIGDRGFEGDNNSKDNAASPFANPTLANITLVGGYENGEEAGKYGMKLREGTKGKIYNAVVTGFDKRSIHVEHNQTLTNVNNGHLVVDYAVLNSDVSDAVIKYSVSKVMDGDTEIDDPDGPTVEENSKFETSSNVTIEVVAKSTSATFTGGKDVSSDDSWFESDSKIGSGDSWLDGWARTDF
ncbi:MAG: hypothetical protein ACOCWB_07185 [Bacteroidota bacterium]